jgi:hypothetical protein
MAANRSYHTIKYPFGIHKIETTIETPEQQQNSNKPSEES